MKTSLDLLPSIMLQKDFVQNREAETALKDACAEFEAILVQKMLRSMKSSVPEGGLIRKSMAQKLFEEMQDEQIARDIAKSGAFGLAEMMQRHIDDRKNSEK